MENKRIYFDKDGVKWLADENGNPLRDERNNLIPPTHSEKNSKDGEFTTFDTARGHCGLCGNLYCRGNCFK